MVSIVSSSSYSLRGDSQMKKSHQVMVLVGMSCVFSMVVFGKSCQKARMTIESPTSQKEQEAQTVRERLTSLPKYKEADGLSRRGFPERNTRRTSFQPGIKPLVRK